MKILLVNKYHYLKGGAERAYFDTARILEEHGHEVAYFSMAHPDNLPVGIRWQEHFIDEVDYGTEPRNIWGKIGVAIKILWNRQASRRLEVLLGEFHPDVAHLHNIYHQLSPSIIWTLKRHGIPMVMTLHDYKLISPNYNLFSNGAVWERSRPDAYWRCVADRCVKDSRAKSLVCTIEAYLHDRIFHTYENIGAFIAPSRFLMEKFEEYDFPKPVAHVPQPLVPFPDAPIDMGTETTIDDAPFVFVGRLSPEKGVATAIDAMKLYHGQSELLIVGDGPERSVLEEQVRREGVGPCVRFLGKKYGDELQGIVRGAKALVLPSVWYENMPYVMLEALGSGVPVIGSDMGGISERVHDGENGFLFPAGNAFILAEKLRAVERLERNDVQRAAHASVDDLRAEIYYERLMEVYASVLPSVT